MPPVIPSVGLNRTGQRILDDTLWIAVGTSTTRPTVTDSQLVAETNRVAVTQTLRSANRIQMQAFFGNANLPATVEECGLFMNATSSANSGLILIRARLSFAKGANNDLVIVMEMTLVEGSVTG